MTAATFDGRDECELAIAKDELYRIRGGNLKHRGHGGTQTISENGLEKEFAVPFCAEDWRVDYIRASACEVQ